MEVYIKYKQKQRPLTSKSRENQYINQPSSRPETSKVRRTGSVSTKDLKSNNCGGDLKSYRLGRPGSAIRDNYFNKFWEETAQNPNAIHSTTNKMRPLSGDKTNKMRPLSGDKTNKVYTMNQGLGSEEARKLYNYDKLEWDQKKSFNFLTNVGGIDINRNNFNFIFDTTNPNSTYNTDKYTSRPGTGFLQVPVPNDHVRPFTAKETGNMKKPRIVSDISEVKQEQNSK